MNGSTLKYCRSGGTPRGIGKAGVEPQRVGDDERRHAEYGVGQDVNRHEQAVVPIQHEPFSRRCRTDAPLITRT